MIPWSFVAGPIATAAAPTLVAKSFRGIGALLFVALSGCASRAVPSPPPPPLASPDAMTTSGLNLSPVLTVSGNGLAGEVPYGTMVSLDATCIDREDGPILAIRWSTDEGILLGEGPSLRHMPEPGSHLVLATCTDRGGRAISQAATSRFTVVDRWTAADSVPVVVTLPFVTNRAAVVGTRSPGAAFDGGARDSLARGVLTFNVPSREFRRSGSASRTPFMRSVRGNFPVSDATQLLLRAHEPVDSIALATRLRAALAESGAGDVLVFVHGYNTSFEGAAIRAARLMAGMQYPGALVLFSWPSDGELANYRLDQRDARAAGAQLAQVLAELREVAGSRRVSVVAHSMGGEVLASALRSLDAAQRPLVLGDAVFIAPDVAAGEFLQVVLPSLRARAARVTVYASAADFALWSSWGSNRERRLGLGGRFATLARGVETVEVSYDHTDRLGHNPFDAEGFRDDLHRLLVQGLGASRRGLASLTRDDGQVMWRLP
ncbi:MAG: alpha/beta hydrolase [Gemmatimonadota bacterium]